MDLSVLCCNDALVGNLFRTVTKDQECKHIVRNVLIWQRNAAALSVVYSSVLIDNEAIERTLSNRRT